MVSQATGVGPGERLPGLVVCATTAITPWAIMRGQLGYLRAAGFDVTLISAPGPLLQRTAQREGVTVRPVPMSREIHPARDLRSLGRLVRVYRRLRPDISLVSTPKAGLLAGIAAWLTRVPRRVYVLRGLRLETSVGARRVLLWAMEWVALHVAQDVVVVSPSLLARARALRLLGGHRGLVLGAGASNGVELERFESRPDRVTAAAALRESADIPAEAFVFGFVGRLAVDKGVRELASAFDSIAQAHSQAWLLVVGDRDESEPAELPAETVAILDRHPRVRRTGWLAEPAVAYLAMDALVLPTYREGFPNVSLEAAAAGRPVITTTATGAIDSIIDGKTGIAVPAGDTRALAEAMRQLLADPLGADELGRRGHEFVHDNFRSEQVHRNLCEFLFDGGSGRGKRARQLGSNRLSSR